MKNCCEKKIPERLHKVGGQAVLEGVMMKAGERTVTTCRKDDGTLVVTDSTFVSIKKKYKILGLPLIRGVVGFIESLVLSMKTLNISAEALGIDEETEDGKVAKWMKKHLGMSVTDVIMVIATVLGVVLSLFLFMFLPTFITNALKWLWTNTLQLGAIHPSVLAVVEGIVKVGIFILYLALVALMPDIKRTFMYHGAEHKSIACFEAGEELTPENAMKHKRFHPRCGTSFMFLMILLGIFAGMFIRNLFPTAPAIVITLLKLATLPIVMGVGYEVLMLAGKHDNVITRIVSAPGMWVQRITTKEPTEDMLEVAITSIKCALREDFPEFAEFYEARPWEKKTDENAELQINVDNFGENADDAVEISAAETATEGDTAIGESLEGADAASSEDAASGESLEDADAASGEEVASGADADNTVENEAE